MKKNNLCFLMVACLVYLGVAMARADLVGYWKFDETSGTNAFATVGSVNGALRGNASFVQRAGISGGALHLDTATDDYVDFGINFMFTGSFSVQAWVKTLPGETAGLVPVAKHVGGFLNGYFLAINDVNDGIGGSGASKAHFYVSRPATGPSTTVVTDGQWHQLVGVCNATNGTAEIFVDGTLQSTGQQSGVIANSAPFLVGALVVGGVPLSSYRGLIDEVRLYDHAVSAAEVLRLYRDTPAPTLTITLFSATQVQLCWNSITNKTYQVQYTSSVTGAVVWNNLGVSMQGNDGTACLMDSRTNATLFYQVVTSAVAP